MLIAYDLETTRIAAGTPRLLYVTAHGATMRLSMPITGDNRLQTYCNILETYFLIPEHNKAKMVAWNGNNFDVYFTALALLKSDNWIIQPYLTASKALRGMMVKSKNKVKIRGKMRVLQFQFLDGISMTGLMGKSLRAFLQTFAPDLPKLNIGNMDEVDFDIYNPRHIKYAERDSEGLYKGMSRVQEIINDLTKPLDLKDKWETPLKPTIGNLAVNFFMDNAPVDKPLNIPHGALQDILHGPVKRGGFCWCMKQYTGPVWKYDINQAYAAAMRDAALPAGICEKTEKFWNDVPGIYEVTFFRKQKSKIPFYYKIETDNIGRFSLGEKPITTWLTSIEIKHLLKQGWAVTVHYGYAWDDSFNFAPIVERLEKLRLSDPQGPSGPLGTMVKAIGNNAYGKTLERLNGLDLVLARECPKGFDVLNPFDDDSMIFVRTHKAFYKNYHLPQVGIFVTAHVRCQVRDAALKAPDHFLYADTDCVVFSKPVKLDIHPTRYGAWKVEAEGVPYIIIGKKIYYGDDGSTKAKGLRTKELTKDNYLTWLNKLPEQEQVQRQNFLKFIAGESMFKMQKRTGTDVKQSKIYGVKNGEYIPN